MLTVDSLPATEEDIRDMIRKSLEAFGRERGAAGGAAMNTLAFLDRELQRIGRRDIYEDEHRKHEWRSLGFDPEERGLTKR